MRLFFYISKHYIKDFFLLLLALAFVITLVDFVQHISSIEGVNREFLYFIYTFANSIMMMYPLALVFATLMTITRLISNNHLTVLGSFGYAKRILITPLLTIVFVIYTLVTLLNATQFAYSSDTARAIIDKRQLFKTVENIFFKYNDSFVYVEKLEVANKVLRNIIIYKVEDKKIEHIYKIKSAVFKNGAWLANDILLETIVFNSGIPQGFRTEHIDKKIILKGYFPKVISLLYEGKRMSIQDGFKALKLLNDQNVDSSKVIAALYEKLLMPLFAPLLIILIIIYTPLSKRYMNRLRFYLLGIAPAILVWILLYGVNILSINGVLPAAFSQPLIILTLFFVTLYLWIKESGKIAK